MALNISGHETKTYYIALPAKHFGEIEIGTVMDSGQTTLEQFSDEALYVARKDELRIGFIDVVAADGWTTDLSGNFKFFDGLQDYTDTNGDYFEITNFATIIALVGCTLTVDGNDSSIQIVTPTAADWEFEIDGQFTISKLGGVTADFTYKEIV